MNDDELRMLIRAAIQRHMGTGAATLEMVPAPETVRLKPDATGSDATGSVATGSVAISFGQYRIERAAGDTSCIIEPAVQCNHCGFCKCHGH